MPVNICRLRFNIFMYRQASLITVIQSRANESHYDGLVQERLTHWSYVFSCTKLSIEKGSIFFQKYSLKTPWLVHESEIWGVFCEFDIWSMFNFCYYSSQYAIWWHPFCLNHIILASCYTRHSTVLAADSYFNGLVQDCGNSSDLCIGNGVTAVLRYVINLSSMNPHRIQISRRCDWHMVQFWLNIWPSSMIICWATASMCKKNMYH